MWLFSWYFYLKYTVEQWGYAFTKGLNWLTPHLTIGPIFIHTNSFKGKESKYGSLLSIKVDIWKECLGCLLMSYKEMTVHRWRFLGSSLFCIYKRKTWGISILLLFSLSLSSSEISWFHMRQKKHRDEVSRCHLYCFTLFISSPVYATSRVLHH